MPRFLTLHREPEKSIDDMDEAYSHLASETTAVWVRTYYSREDGRRICEWEAPSEESMVVIFKRTGITWDEIIEVEEVLPGRWRR